MNFVGLTVVSKEAMFPLNIVMISEKHALEIRELLPHSNEASGGSAADW